MKKILCLLLILGVIGCSSKRQFPLLSDGLQAGVEFQNACMQGDFEKANFYMLQDARNIQLLNEAKERYQSLNKEQKRQLREASLQNFTVENITPEEMVIHYTNSFNNESGKLKVLQKEKGSWLVDFKFKFDPNL